MHNNIEIQEPMYIQLKKEYYYYPYMDTFCYLDEPNNRIYHIAPYAMRTKDLDQTLGGPNATFYCDICNDLFVLDDRELVHGGEAVCPYCLEQEYIYMEEEGEYYHQIDLTLDKDGMYIINKTPKGIELTF